MVEILTKNTKGNSFYLEAHKNFGVINFQKSRESTKEVVKFTINFGVYSDVLGQLQYDYNSSVKPEVEQCHWLARVGAFMKDSPDFWWEVKVSDDLNRVASNVIDIVQNIAMPEMNKRLNDDGLISCWMNEAFAGTTEIGRFKYVTTLLKAKGDFNTLNQIVETFMEKLKGKPNASIATEHLKEIEYSK
ncbi:MAG: DUF4304 domain-containing protein [Flavobacterium sp.]|nr:MAG: DUF4304 domain-containing protein [Flavobacterium sp.]